MSIVYIYVEKHKPSMLKHFQLDDLRVPPDCNERLKKRVLSEFEEIDYISYFVQPFRIIHKLNEENVECLSEDLNDTVAIDLLVKKEKEAIEKSIKKQKDDIIKKAIDDFILPKD